MKALLQALLNGTIDDEITTWAVMYLVKLGYVVEMPGHWETPGQYCRRIGISRRTFHRHMRSKWRPQVDLETGPHGRINRLRANTAFDEFMRRRCHETGSCQKSARSGQLSASDTSKAVASVEKRGRMIPR